MARTLDMRNTVAPDEPLIVLDLDGGSHKVVRLPVWDVLALKALDEDSAEDLERIRALIAKAVPTYPPEHFEAMTVSGYVALVQFILTGERESAQTQAARPTMPVAVSTEPSAASADTTG
jgi:hypothetical protein